MPLKLLQKFLQNRHQRVLLNGQCSSWAPVFAGVPQGSVLGPLFFLIYTNDLTKDISSSNKLFADYTSIFFYCKWYGYFWIWVEQWSEENIYVSLSMEDVLQSRCFKAGSRGDILWKNSKIVPPNCSI